MSLWKPGCDKQRPYDKRVERVLFTDEKPKSNKLPLRMPRGMESVYEHFKTPVR